MRKETTIIYAVFAFILSSCSGVFYQPDQIEYTTPFKFGVKHKELYFKSLDATKLHAWHLLPDDENAPIKGTVIHFHGNAQNISSHFINLSWLTKHNYQIFIFDYRGYGKSQGSPYQKGVYKDALAALDKSWEIHKETKAQKFIVYGQSLGGAIVARALKDSQHKDKVDLLVLDCTFSSYQDIAFDKLKSNWLSFIFSPLAYLLVSDEYAAKPFIPEFKMPKLIIHGDRDIVVPFKFGEEIHRISQSPKLFWKIKDGVHTDVFHRHKFKYRADFLRVLDNLSQLKSTAQDLPSSITKDKSAPHE